MNKAEKMRKLAEYKESIRPSFYKRMLSRIENNANNGKFNAIIDGFVDICGSGFSNNELMDELKKDGFTVEISKHDRTDYDDLIVKW